MNGAAGDMFRMREMIETAAWSAIWLGILIGWLLRLGAWLWSRPGAPSPAVGGSHAARSGHRPTALAIIAALIVLPGAAAAQGWWAAPVRPGFDRNTVITAAGTMTQANLAPWDGPSTLRLETAQEVFTVMLAPGWFLATLHPDLRIGDPISVEGSKLMDRRGNLHVVATRVTNRRTGSVLELRDESGQPRWMGGQPPGSGR